MSQGDVAEALGMSLDTVSRMERGLPRYPIEKRTAIAVQAVVDQRLAFWSPPGEREGDVPLIDAMIIWDHPGEQLDPPVKVVACGSQDDDRYSCSRGACDGDWKIGGAMFRLARLFSLVQQMTLQDGIAPRAVHDALIVIPEYRSIMYPSSELGLGRGDDA